MPTETQHLEQRVAALQSDLNKKDEQIGALTFSDNDRELSRRSWFDEAKQLEKEVEALRADLAQRPSQIAMSLQTKIKNLQAKLAERDALLAKVRKFCWSGSDAERIARTRAEVIAALSASADPAKSCGACGGCADGCKLDRESPPVERDERADFDEWFRKEKGLHPEACTTYIDAAFMPYRAWQARAALDKATKGASIPDGYAVVPIKPTKAMRNACRVAGKLSVWSDMMAAALDCPDCGDTDLEPCSKHGWKP